jgi:hypothetical protein
MNCYGDLQTDLGSFLLLDVAVTDEDMKQKEENLKRGVQA